MRSVIYAVVLFAFCAVPGSARAQGALDACTLIRAHEIQTVQGLPVAQTTSYNPPRQRLAVSQCFYAVEPFERSVSLEVTRQLPPAQGSTAKRSAVGVTARQEWDRLFHSKSSKAAEPQVSRARSASAKKKAGPPRRIKGIGDEAFWVGDQVVGVLYVLAGDTYFRISIGGWADENGRQKKSKALARIVVKRLSESGVADAGS